MSNGGETQVLTSNLNKYASFVGNQSHFGKTTVLFTECDISPYESGIWMSWGSDGNGVSSASANFTLVFNTIDSETEMEHATNITTSINVDGTYSLLEETNKQVNITCNVLNEDKPALAQNITLAYDYDGSLGTQDWIQVDSPTITDCGNGTYTIVFNADTQTRTAPLHISTQVHDMRDVFVMANATCVEV
ncbi:MAG: hypothetical protein CW716_00075 [Candidatus Bathyarchaeum sp.]|nr:MAG: hypothetical protein CW716_00075 [Candidatus Bathyarchaeum sp.]